eukprot:6187563-Pleurochrysis_carterae.AAC.7
MSPTAILVPRWRSARLLAAPPQSFSVLMSAPRLAAPRCRRSPVSWSPREALQSTTRNRGN